MTAPRLTLEETLARLSSLPTDEAAWTDLYLRLWPFVLGRVARHVHGSSTAAEDLAQEVFLRLAHYKPFDRLTNPDELRAYLTVMCRNVASNYIRRLLRNPATDSLEGPLSEVLPAPATSDNASAEEDLWRTLSEGLSPRDRELLSLLVAGFDTREIAEASGATYGTTAVRMWRLRQRLRRRLAAGEGS